MSWIEINMSLRKLTLFAAFLCLAAFSPASTLGQTTFPGTGLGAIPDGGAACAPSPGAPLNVTFAVTGMTAPLTAVQVNVTFSPAHTWVGDLDVTLTAPGGSPSHIIFTQTAPGGTNDSSNAAGPYMFFDTAPAAPSWWTAAAGGTSAFIIPSGSYRTSDGAGSNTLGTPVFAGLTSGQINGTWTATFTDGCGADTGSVGSASLILTGGAAAPLQHVVDFNGDGRTDFSVVRNTGGGPSGQITWFNRLSGAGTESGAAWGLGSDFFTPEDFDGDLKTDIAIWRPGAPTVAAFYILQSLTNTVRIETFGQTGDDPSVVGDYNNDGSADVAVYRPGATAGAQSTWFYRTAAGGPVTYTPWGQNGDFPAPGDYDGDGRHDFVIQRNNGGGQAAFWKNLTTAGTSVEVFGTPTDVIVPGDYDGDGKTDIAVARGIGGVINWFFEPSGTAGTTVVYNQFGASATDFICQGDYDGDGKTDIAVWRPNVDSTQNFFWTLASSNGAVALTEWGQNGDYPVANYNTH